MCGIQMKKKKTMDFVMSSECVRVILVFLLFTEDKTKEIEAKSIVKLTFWVRCLQCVKYSVSRVFSLTIPLCHTLFSLFVGSSSVMKLCAGLITSVGQMSALFPRNFDTMCTQNVIRTGTIRMSVQCERQITTTPPPQPPTKMSLTPIQTNQIK